MYTPPARRTGLNKPYSRRDRAETERETIVSRLPLRPPAETPPPVLLRPVPAAPRHDSESDPGTGGRAARGSGGLETFLDPTPQTGPRPAPRATPDPLEAPAPPDPAPADEPIPDYFADPVPNLRPRPQHGLWLALIGLGALGVGAVTAMIAQEVDVSPVAVTAEAAPDTPPARPVVISDLSEPSEAAPTAPPATATPAPVPVRAAAPSRDDGPRGADEPSRARRPDDATARPRRALADDGDDQDEDDDEVAEDAPGYLTIDAIPYATIYVDGDEIGDTPIIRHELPPGRHHIEAVSSAGGSEQLSVRIQSGETVRRRLGAPP